MTIEEAIETIEYARAFNEKNTLLMKAWDLIIDYVRAQSVNDGQMKSDGWISVKDRLPEKSGSYIVHSGASGKVFTSHFWTSDKRWSGRSIRLNVTHWMPLPEPPKCEGGDEA